MSDKQVKSERRYTEQDLEDAFCAGKKRQRWEMPVDKAGFDGTPPMFIDWLKEMKEKKANTLTEDARGASELMRLVSWLKQRKNEVDKEWDKAIEEDGRLGETYQHLYNSYSTVIGDIIMHNKEAN